jgi:beta-glucanase (GH16 family)
MMKKSLIAFLSLSIACIVYTGQLYAVSYFKIAPKYTDTTLKKHWKLVWSDEFNYNGLPDSTKWGFETGLLRNNEKEYYTKARKENAFVKNGFLYITGIKEKYPNAVYKAGSADWQKKDSLADYTSADICTQGKASWKYGKVEVRAKIPAGKGMWPAIWMLGDNISKAGWPACGEIDIMENVGFEPNRVYATMHYADPATKKHAANGKFRESNTLSTDFHIYTLEWDKKLIKISIDNNLYQIFNIDDAGKGIDNCFRQKQFLILDLALGGDWGGPIDDQVLPQQYIIDYVRVYQ